MLNNLALVITKVDSDKRTLDKLMQSYGLITTITKGNYFEKLIDKNDITDKLNEMLTPTIFKGNICEYVRLMKLSSTDALCELTHFDLDTINNTGNIGIILEQKEQIKHYKEYIESPLLVGNSTALRPIKYKFNQLHISKLDWQLTKLQLEQHYNTLSIQDKRNNNLPNHYYNHSVFIKNLMDGESWVSLQDVHYDIAGRLIDDFINKYSHSNAYLYLIELLPEANNISSYKLKVRLPNKSNNELDMIDF